MMVLDILIRYFRCHCRWHLHVNYRQVNYSNSIPFGSLLESASEMDNKSNELKMSIIKHAPYPFHGLFYMWLRFHTDDNDTYLSITYRQTAVDR